MKLTTIMDMAIVSSLLAAPTCDSPLAILHDFNSHLNDSVGVLALMNSGGGVVRSGYLDHDDDQVPEDVGGILPGTYLTGSGFSVSDAGGYLILSSFPDHLGLGQFLYNGPLRFSPAGSGSDPDNLMVKVALAQLNAGTRTTQRAYINHVLMNSIIDSGSAGNLESYGAGGLGGRALAGLFREGTGSSSSSGAAGGDSLPLREWNAVFAKSLSTTVIVVPEPSTYLAGLSALGMLGMFGWRNRK